MRYNIIIHKNNNSFGCRLNTPGIDWEWIYEHYNRNIQNLVDNGYEIIQTTEFIQDGVESHLPCMHSAELINKVSNQVVKMDIKIEENI